MPNESQILRCFVCTPWIHFENENNRFISQNSKLPEQTVLISHRKAEAQDTLQSVPPTLHTRKVILGIKVTREYINDKLEAWKKQTDLKKVE